MNYVFQSSPIAWQQWVVILALGVALYLIVEIEKWITSLTSRSLQMHVHGGLVRSEGALANTSTDTGN